MATHSMHEIFKAKCSLDLFTTVTSSTLPRNPKVALPDLNWKEAMTDEFNAPIEK